MLESLVIHKDYRQKVENKQVIASKIKVTILLTSISHNNIGRISGCGGYQELALL